MEKHIEEYKNSLTEQEKLVLHIAIEHLGSSFNIEKSIGFLTWYEEHCNTEKSNN